MIYTVTFNPAIDYVVFLNRLEQGQVNRTVKEVTQCGGKGINVSVVLKNLGVENVAFGFLAGFTGKSLESRLKASGVNTDFVFLKKGDTRINIQIKAQDE